MKAAGAIEADRRPPRKLQRPFAAGDLPAIAGISMAAVFLLLAFRCAPASVIGLNPAIRDRVKSGHSERQKT